MNSGLDIVSSGLDIVSSVLDIVSSVLDFARMDIPGLAYIAVVAAGAQYFDTVAAKSGPAPYFARTLNKEFAAPNFADYWGLVLG